MIHCRATTKGSDKTSLPVVTARQTFGENLVLLKRSDIIYNLLYGNTKRLDLNSLTQHNGRDLEEYSNQAIPIYYDRIYQNHKLTLSDFERHFDHFHEMALHLVVARDNSFMDSIRWINIYVINLI